ncbi:hypothetical protein QQ045_003413 [Rhodiola kirilowii]
MSSRKHESGFLKLQEKRKIEALMDSQKGALDKVIVRSSLSEETENPSLNENEIVHEDVYEVIIKENSHIDCQTHEQVNDSSALNTIVSKIIYDPSQWTQIDKELKDLLVERGPIHVTSCDFPKDKRWKTFFHRNIFFTNCLMENNIGEDGSFIRVT